MSYQWGPQGPAFEFANVYRVENRFLTLRAGGLMLSALVILWVALAEPDPDSGVSARMLELLPPNPTPHVLLAGLLLVLAMFDLFSVARRLRVVLLPGQPASLTSELTRQNKGAGVAWLSEVMRGGSVPLPEPAGPYRRLLQRLAPQAAAAPASVQDYLGVRLAHLGWGLGLLLALGLSALLIGPAPNLALAALWYSGVTAALVARSAWISRSPPSPLGLVITGVLTTVVGLLLGWFGGGLPAIGRLAQLALTPATAVLLLALVLIEGLALMAARVAVDRLPPGGPPAGEAHGEVAADAERLMHEVERELHRYWTEGIANRRHAWQVALDEGKGGDEGFSALVLEESQPVQAGSDAREPPAPAARARERWLLALALLGLALTVLGCVAGARLAYEQMTLPTATWVLGAVSVVLVVAGGYALRVGHLLWSRLEVESLLIGVEATAQGEGRPLQLRWRVLRARSVFYADARHVVGNRTLLQLSPDEASARRSLQQVRSFAERAARANEDRLPGAASVTPRASIPAASAAARAAQARRFCPACGTAVVPGGRFCQACGAAQPPA